MAGSLAALTIDQWIQLGVAVGSLGAAIASAVAARSSYRVVKEMRQQTVEMRRQTSRTIQEMHNQTIQMQRQAQATISEMRRQTELMRDHANQTIEEMKKQTDYARKSFLESFAPKIVAEWVELPSLDGLAGNGDIEVLSNIFPQDKNGIERLPEGERKDALELLTWWRDNPSRYSETTLKYLLLQIRNEQVYSVASKVNVKLQLFIPKPMVKPDILFNIEYEIEACYPHKKLCIPLRIEGVPKLEAKIIKIEYMYREERGDANSSSGWAYSYSASARREELESGR